MAYRTPEGLDEGEHLPLERFEEYDNAREIKTFRYGHTLMPRGGNYSTKIWDELYRRRNNNESIVITITGPPGSGKTYFGIRLAQKLDPKFHINDTPAPPPHEDTGQIAFNREHLSYLTGPKSPLKRDQVIVLDESHFGVGARSWQNSKQQEVTNYLASIRSKGLVLIMVVLHTDMVDKLLRNFVINYEFSMIKRGTALVYRRFYPPRGHKVWSNRLGPLELLMPDEGLCNWGSCLRCDFLDKEPGKRCVSMRAVYERRKDAFLAARSALKEEEYQAESRVPRSQLLIELESLKSRIPTRGKGSNKRVNQSRLGAFVLDELGHSVTVRTLSSLAGDIENASWWSPEEGSF